MTTDFSFDERVIKRYNEARAHPPDVSQKVGEAIAALVAPDAPLLEIGVGTGRIGWPVAAQGRQVIGFDLSPHMLGEVERTRPESLSGALRLTRADMHHMPFASNRFGGVLAVHVLHLAKDWQQVLREASRVLRAGGAIIQGDDWIDPTSVIGIMRHELRMHAVRLDPSLMPPAALASKQDYMLELGGTTHEEIIAAEWEIMMSPAERLDIIEQKVDAESWIFSDEMFAKMLAHLRQFAAQKWPDLEAQQVVKRRFVLKVTRGDWGAA